MQSEAGNERRAGRPTTEETGRLNEEILQAAFKVFVKEGFGGASMEQIAQESRTTRRSVLNRFHDKETLLIAVVEMNIWQLQKKFMPSESMLAAKPLDTLKELSALMLENCVSQEVIDFFCLCLAHVVKFPAISVAVLRWNDRLAADLAVLVERAQRSGAFPGRDPAMVATGLIGAFISNPINRAALGDVQFREPLPLRQYFDGLWSFFVQDL
jgi:TetR/AcrR family transcriptional repressor of mexJK operon